MRTRVVWHGNELIPRVREVLKTASSEALEHILRESILKAPLDESTLIQSAGSQVIESARGVEGSVFYDTPYAARLHEHPEYNFQNGRQGKYLESVVEAERQVVSEYISNRVQEVLRSGGG